MSQSRKPYPNVLWNAEPLYDQRASNKRGVRRFSAAAARKISLTDVKETNCPRFKCEYCRTMHSMSYAVFARDTRKAFAAPTFYCRDCAKLHKAFIEKA